MAGEEPEEDPAAREPSRECGATGVRGGGPIRNPFMIVPDLPAGTEEEPEKERVDASAASAEVAALLTSPAGVSVLVDTGAKWDGLESIASLEAHNGVTKSRGVIFAPVMQFVGLWLCLKNAA
jgi:hypothetical protein